MTDLGPKRSTILPEHSVLASTAEHRLVAHQAGPVTKEAEAVLDSLLLLSDKNSHCENNLQLQK